MAVNNKQITMSLRQTVLIFLALLPIGCGDHRDDKYESNHGYGWHYDAQGQTTGIRVRWDAATYPLTIEQIEALYMETAACSGIDARAVPAPMLITVEHAPKGFMGIAHLDTGLILIWHMVERYPAIYRHEFVHYLLWRMGYPDDLNMAHESPLFDQCDARV